MNKLMRDSHDAWAKEAIALRKLHMEALKEIEQLKAQNAALTSNAVYTAIYHYQKQGFCEGNEYGELERARECLSKLR